MTDKSSGHFTPHRWSADADRSIGLLAKSQRERSKAYNWFKANLTEEEAGIAISDAFSRAKQEQ